MVMLQAFQHALIASTNSMSDSNLSGLLLWICFNASSLSFQDVDMIPSAQFIPKTLSIMGSGSLPSSIFISFSCMSNSFLFFSSLASLSALDSW